MKPVRIFNTLLTAASLLLGTLHAQANIGNSNDDVSISERASTKKNDTPQIDYEKNGVNTEHLFIFSDTLMTYNGRPFSPGMTIDQICEVFGRYDRQPRKGLLVWDNVGITMEIESDLDNDRIIVSDIIIEWKNDIIKWKNDLWNDIWGEFANDYKPITEPHNLFQGNIILGGTPWNPRSSYQTTSLEFFNIMGIYYCYLEDWNDSEMTHNNNKLYLHYSYDNSRFRAFTAQKPLNTQMYTDRVSNDELMDIVYDEISNAILEGNIDIGTLIESIETIISLPESLSDILTKPIE